jgi:orotate phosphoribosyltransferase
MKSRGQIRRSNRDGNKTISTPLDRENCRAMLAPPGGNLGNGAHDPGAGYKMSVAMGTIDPTIMSQIRRDGLLREGHFSFRSGRHTGALLDRDRLLADPGFASHMGYVIAKRFFTEKIETVASPSIWGAGLAQWVGYFLDPRAKIVYSTPRDGEPTIAAELENLVHDRRVLLIDNLIVSGDTMTRFTENMEQRGATVVGVATLWNVADAEIAGHPAFGLLNSLYEAYPAADCPYCQNGAPAATEVSY